MNRDYAGGYGTGSHTDRDRYGHSLELGPELMPNVLLSFGTGYLRQSGHEVHFLDAQAGDLDLPKLATHVEAIRPQLIYTCLNLPSFDGDVRALGYLREKLPETAFVVTGTVTKALLPDVLAKCSPDAVLSDNADRHISAFASAMDRGGIAGLRALAATEDGNAPGLIQVQTSGPSDGTPIPAYDLMPLTKYRYTIAGEDCRYAPVYASRGCPYPCSYCPYPLGLGKTVQFREPEAVAKEISYLAREFDVEGIVFRDQTFTLDARRTDRLLDAMISERTEVRWLCETRVDRLTEPMVAKMYRAGCQQVDLGMESGDPTIFEKTGKPGAAYTDLIKATRLLHKHGINVHCHVIVGLPGETRASIENTLQALYGLRVDSTHINLLTPYPGTPIYEWAVREGLIVQHDWASYTAEDPVMRSDKMSIEDLVAGQAYLYRRLREEAPLPFRIGRSLRYLQASDRPLRRIARSLRRRARRVLASP